MTRSAAAITLLAALLPTWFTACTGTVARGPATTELRGACELPCRLQQGLFLVTGRLGDEDHTFLLDTGTDRMVLDVDVGRRLAVATGGSGTVRCAAGVELPHAGFALVPRLQLGAAVFTDVPASLLDLSGIAGSTGQPIAGILGCDLFCACELELDYPGRRITVRALPEQPPAGAIPFTGTIPTVAAMLDGQPMELLVDTGFQRTLSLPPDAALRWRRPPRPDGELVTVAGSEPKWLGRLRGALDLGGHRWADPWVTLAPGSAKIGASALRDLVLTLHAAAGRIWLRRR